MKMIVTAAGALLLASGCSAAPAGEGAVQEETQEESAGSASPAPGAAPTGGVADPLAWARRAYEPYREPTVDEAAEGSAGDGRYSATPEFSPRLRALFAEEEAYADGQVGRLEFNPISGAQDEDISGVDVTSADVDGAPDRKIVTATFRNGTVDQTIVYHWERIGGLWYIDDIAGRTGGEASGWTLSLILKYGSHGP